MTREEAIKKLSQSVVVIGCENWMGARDLALETMRKYQKIEKIVKAWNDMNSFDSMLQISEVLEDGNEK